MRRCARRAADDRPQRPAAIRPSVADGDARTGAVDACADDGPASSGALSWFQDEGDEVSVGDGCAEFVVNEEGTPYYAVVARAHGASGQSAFAIAEPGYFYDGPCYSDDAE